MPTGRYIQLSAILRSNSFTESYRNPDGRPKEEDLQGQDPQSSGLQLDSRCATSCTV